MSRIKSKVVRSTIQNKDVLDMFHGVLGTGDNAPVKLAIAYPKYQLMERHAGRFLTLLAAFRDSQAMAKFPEERKQLVEYCNDLKGSYEDSFCAPNIDAYVGNLGVAYEAIPAEVAEKFAEVFHQVKKCHTVNTAVITCKNLVTHKRQIEDEKALSDRFLVRSAGTKFAPLEGLPDFNLRQLYIADVLNSEEKRLILLVIHKMYTVTHDIYEAVSSPDVDVNDFVEIIMSSITDVRRHIPRCDEAFDKIADSVGLLKDNFNGYYSDFVASNNPTIIMENYVLDVSKSTKSSPKVTQQFRKIITHYRKLASQQAQNPQMKTLFAQVDKNFQELERRKKEADEHSDSEEEENEEDAKLEEPDAPDAPDAPDSPEIPEDPDKQRRKANRAARRRAKRLRQQAKRRAGRQAAESTAEPSTGNTADEGLAEEFARCGVYEAEPLRE